jgi:hypothetical protein
MGTRGPDCYLAASNETTADPLSGRGAAKGFLGERRHVLQVGRGPPLPKPIGIAAEMAGNITLAFTGWDMPHRGHMTSQINI